MRSVISNGCHSNNHSGNPTSNDHAPNSNFNYNPGKHKFDASNNTDDLFSFISNTEMKILLVSLMGMNLLDLNNLYNTVFVKLDKRNGYIADYSPILTTVLGCHTNALLLGSSGKSKGASHYIGPYVSKNKTSLGESLDLIWDAMQHAKLFPSVAEDKNTNERFTQYILTQVMNKLRHPGRRMPPWIDRILLFRKL